MAGVHKSRDGRDAQQEELSPQIGQSTSPPPVPAFPVWARPVTISATAGTIMNGEARLEESVVHKVQYFGLPVGELEVSDVGKDTNVYVKVKAISPRKATVTLWGQPHTVGQA